MSVLARTARSASRAWGARDVHIEARLKTLGYKLPAVSVPQGSYCLSNEHGDLLFTGELDDSKLQLLHSR